MKKLLLFLLLVVGCDVQPKTSPLTPLDFKCVKLRDNARKHGYFYRCENVEVVCYSHHQYRASGLTCQWKK